MHSKIHVRADRMPQQKRSKESFKRLLDATLDLMREKGDDSFTLMEISKRSKVSIGSIYLRFNGKVDLLRAIHAELVFAINEQQFEIFSDALATANDEQDLIRKMVIGIAEVFRKNADFLRPMMLIASKDEIIASVGQDGYRVAAERFVDTLLTRRDKLYLVYPVRSLASTYRIIYATIARQLGFGSAAATGSQESWRDDVEDLAAMCTAFLTSKNLACDH